MAHPYPTGMIQHTRQALSRPDTTPETGSDLLKNWISTLKHTAGAEAVAKHLADIYDELLNPTPDGQRIKTLLNTVAGQTATLARDLDTSEAEGLSQLADDLRSFAIDLGQIGKAQDLTDNPTDTGTIYDITNPGDRAQQMINDSLAVFSAGAEATTPEAGAALVEDWITVVRQDVSTQWVETSLTQLRDALTAGDMRTTERVMRELASQTQDLANNTADGRFKTDLTNLATAIISFAGPLS
jgi:hypothetical protein